MRAFYAARGGRQAAPLTRQAPRQAAATRSHRPESRTAASPAASANGRARMPAAMSRSNAARASAFAARRNRRVPPRMRQPLPSSSPSSRAASAAEAIAHCVRPGEVGERFGSDRDRRTADRPFAERRSQRLDDVGRSDSKAETQACEAERLAERAQHDRASRAGPAPGFHSRRRNRRRLRRRSARRLAAQGA